MPGREMEAILPCLNVNEYASGTSVIRQNEPASHFHMIVSGTFNVLAQMDDRKE